MTKDSLDIAAHKGIKFISRLPAVFNQENEVNDKAWAEGGWSEVGGLSRNRRSDSVVYKCKEYVAELFGRPYRLIVVHSSELDKRKADKLERDLSRQKAKLEEKVKKLSVLEFACEPDARAALERLKQESAGLFYSVSGDVEADDKLRMKLATTGHARIQEFSWGRSGAMLHRYISGASP